LWFALGSTLYGIAIAATLAWLVERTNIPGKIWIYAGVPMTLAMPGMLQAMAWVLLASPRIGFINKGLIDAFGLSSAPFNIYTLPGMIFIEGLRMVPTAFLMLVPLLRSMDPSLEEAAAMSGARPSSALRKVTLGLMLPGVLAVTIYQFTSALEQFEVPGILGLPANIFVFSTRIYAALHGTSSLPAYGEANALAMLYLLVAVLSIYAYSRVIAKSERFTVITGLWPRAHLPRIVDDHSIPRARLCVVPALPAGAVGTRLRRHELGQLHHRHSHRPHRPHLVEHRGDDPDGGGRRGRHFLPDLHRRGALEILGTAAP
jgi:iron(III) transport system permease protein